jgi:hypothetical protein
MAKAKKTARVKTASRANLPAGIYDAVVTQIDTSTGDPDEGVPPDFYVKIPHVADDYEFGPFPEKGQHIGPYPAEEENCYVIFREMRVGDPIVITQQTPNRQTAVVTGSAGMSQTETFDPGVGRKWVVSVNVTVAGGQVDYDNSNAYVQADVAFSAGEEGSLSRTFKQFVSESHSSVACADCGSHDHSIDHDAQPAVTATMARTITEETTVTITTSSNCGGFVEGFIVAEIIDHQ